MKKTIGTFIFLSVLLFCLPYGPRAAAEEAPSIIDMHGTRTYIGTAANWAKTWDAGNFQDVTGKDVAFDGSLTVKAGEVGNINAGSGTVTVTGGITASISSYSAVTLSGGIIRGNVVSSGESIALGGNLNVWGSLNAGQSVNFSSGKISVGGTVGAVQSVNFGSGTIAIGGSVTGKDIIFNSNVSTQIGGTVKGHGTIKISDCTLTAKNLDGGYSGTLEIAGYKNVLPQMTNIADILLDANDKVICRQQVQAHELTLKSGSEFVAYSGIVLDILDGPGTLCINPGALTVRYDIIDSPVLIFNSPVGSGTVAFQSDGWSIPTSAVRVYGYDLTESISGNYILYKLNFPGSSGLALDTHSVNFDSKGGSATITARVAPGLQQYADGTKIVWEIHGDSSGISMSASNQTCNISASSSVSGDHTAVLVAYLVDRNGTCLAGYRSDACVISQASGSNVLTGLGDKFLSDTTQDLNVNGDYTFKITSRDGNAPSFVMGTSGVFDVALVKQDGNDYYFKLTAIGAPGSGAGVYVDGGARLLTATVGQTTNLAVCDTSGHFNVGSGKSYVFKITAWKKPTFADGTSGVFKLEFLYQNGNNYYYRITAIGKPGNGCGFYLNGSQQPVSVAMIR